MNEVSIYDNSKIDVGTNIMYQRERRGISRPALCKETGMKINTLFKYEHGVINISALKCIEIAEALGVDVREFFRSSLNE